MGKALLGQQRADAAAARRRQSPKVDAFVDKLAAPAQAASAATGIPARFIIGQAALESGWGKSEIKKADGSTSHNVFGIKATKDWTGKTVTTVTTEYVNGKPQRTVEKFRAYDSYEDAMTDYASLLKSNPRYAPGAQFRRTTRRLCARHAARRLRDRSALREETDVDHAEDGLICR